MSRSSSHLKFSENYIRKEVKPRTTGQAEFLRAIDDHMVTFAFGPAGTGKSYLAVAKALEALDGGKVSRIIITRPVVESAESIGFLPGDVEEKVGPYLVPLVDAIKELRGNGYYDELIDCEVLEIAPLNFIRGRTLKDAFVIFDEAQNATKPQMKLFLTRIGQNCKVVINGDLTQMDIPKSFSGLPEIESVLYLIQDIAFVHLTKRDVVRHKLVADIINAYEKYDFYAKEAIA